MPVTTHPLRLDQRPLSWAVETRVSGPADAAAIAEATAQALAARARSRAVVAWLLDAAGASGVPSDTDALAHHLARLYAAGVHTGAIVLAIETPGGLRAAQLMLAMVTPRVPAARPGEKERRMKTRVFASRREALEWFRASCP